MKVILRCITAMVLCLLLVGGIILTPAQASSSSRPPIMATDISSPDLVTDYKGFTNLVYLFDKQTFWFLDAYGPAHLTLSHEAGIGSLYIMFAKKTDIYTLTDEDTGKTVDCGQYGFLHDFVDVEALFGYTPKNLTISFTNWSTVIRELYVFTSGEVPSFVQKWEPPAEGETDIALFSTHADDEHLFFLGILPYYAQELGYNVQVVYLTDHHNTGGAQRQYEALMGLWNVGVRHYPIWGTCPDYIEDSAYMTYVMLETYGVTRESLLEFVTKQIRRLKPKVAITHDFNGEYGHGQHMVYADLLAEACERSADPKFNPDSADKYGTWDIPKTYFHLYPKNPIVMDWDKPLSTFGGMTAYEVSIKKGFTWHDSQYVDFVWYFRGYETAASILEYNPCYYGLYRTTVGPDVEKNDFFENLTTHAEDQAAAAEAERIAQQQAEEEAKRQAEAERAQKEAEERERIKAEAEATAKAQAEAEAEATRIATEQAYKIHIIVLYGIIVLLLLAVIYLANRLSKKQK